MNRLKKIVTACGALFLVVLVLSSAVFAQADPEVALRSAMETETVEGDLKSAIAQYQEIAESTDRAVAVQALVRMAGCYEKLGAAEARRVYERVIRDFADQPDSVALAQARLERLRSAASAEKGVSLRQVWLDEGGAWVNGTVSSDGRFLSFNDWSSCVPGAEGPCRGELVVRDLEAGTNRVVLTDTRHHPGSWVDASTVSPDGTKVAYAWVDTASWEWVVQILPVGGGATPRTVRRDSAVLWPKAWTPDGRSLLVTRRQKEEPWQIGFLSIETGEFQKIKSLSFGNIGASLSPDGRFIAYETPVGEGTSRDIFVVNVDSGEEVAVVRHPADDHSTVWSPDGTRLLFLSDRTVVPSLWSIAMRDGRPVADAVLLRPDIGEILPLGVTKAGTLYFSSIKEQRNVYRAALRTDGLVSEPPAVWAGRFVDSNWGASLSPDGKRVAYYSERPDTMLVVQNLETGREDVINLELNVSKLYGAGPGWLPDGESLLVAATENARPDTFLCRVDLTTGAREEVAREVGAGFKESRDGRSVYYQQENSTRLVRLDLQTKRETVVVEVGEGDYISNATISPDGGHLAYLHQKSEGVRALLVADLSGGVTQELLREPGVAGGTLFNTLEWAPDQRSLLYVRENELGQTVWRIPIDGGEPVNLGVTLKATIKGPQLHPDGKTLFFTVHKPHFEVWALSNFLPPGK